ncbi:MAG: polysaccharide biosynthesis protein [Methylococcaceae bacterium]|nr:polysaccharide biosynthesis protein [Methylococcaceae bacterium]
MKFRLRSTGAVFIHDMLMIPVAWFGAYWLRFNLGVIPDFAINHAVEYFPYVIIIQTLFFHTLGLYRGVWRFASVPDLMRIVKAVTGGVLAVAAALFLLSRLNGVPRSVLPLYSAILILLLCGPRFVYRFWKDNRRSERIGPRSIVIGAGMAGEMLVRDLLRENRSDYVPIGFVDDDRAKLNRDIHGIRVLGPCEALRDLIEREQVQIILIAIPSANDAQMRRIVEFCESCNVPFLTLPSVSEVLSGRATRDELRDVSIGDLLGRAPVRLDWQPIRSRMEHKTVLVTGGGGSIGSELCNQISRLSIAKLVILEKSEFNLYKVEADLRCRHPGLSLLALLGDVTDESAVDNIVSRFRPDVIYHAAAYKHVPLLETQVREAVKNNIIGTKILAEAAIRHQVSEFVLISTDKAVNPTNVMGSCKRAAEILCQNFNHTGQTRFITVRFGNVLDSAGSVVPLFRQQIRDGGPITVTDPEITRFFMTIPEACQLILEAAAVGNGGEIFILDMGEPVKISYLAEQMIRLSGKRPNEDIKIEYIGLRPGEKMHEELFHQKEKLVKTAHKKLFLARSREYDGNELRRRISELQTACIRFDDDSVLRLLKELVPEYSRVETSVDNLVYIQGARKREFA